MGVSYNNKPERVYMYLQAIRSQNRLAKVRVVLASSIPAKYTVRLPRVVGWVSRRLPHWVG